MSRIKRKSMWCVALLLFLVFLAAGASAAPPDTEGHWAEERILSWLERDLISGYEDGTFRPDESVTRAQFVAFVNRAFGFEERQEDHGFTDVEEGAWYVSHVERAAAAGYISGYEDNTFGPQHHITRAEAASVLYSLLDLPDADNGLLDVFADADEIPGWSREPVEAVLSQGLLSGYPDGNFGPAEDMTRAESVALLDRALEWKEGERVFELTFYVVDEEGAPQEDAVILLNDEEYVTGEDGLVTVEKEPGAYDYLLEKDGFMPVQGVAEVRNEDVTLQVSLQGPSASLGLDQEEYRADETINITVENTGPTDMQLGHPFDVHKLVDDEWIEIELDIAWIMVLESLKPGEQFEQELNPAEDFKEEPEAGRYRVQKTVECLDTGVSLQLEEEFDIIG